MGRRQSSVETADEVMHEMVAELSHERLDVYRLYLDVAGLCGDLISDIEVSMVVLDHLDRAVESIGVNLIRGNAQQCGSPKRASYLDVSIASTHECAASLDVCLARKAIEGGKYTDGMGKLWRIRGMLLGLKRTSNDRVREERAEYGAPRFPHANLDMYQAALEGVRLMCDLLAEPDLNARMKRKLDVSTTGTVLNIAEGYGRLTTADRTRFMKTALEHAYQTVLLLDLMVARGGIAGICTSDAKDIQVRAISMLHAWCAKNDESE